MSIVAERRYQKIIMFLRFTFYLISVIIKYMGCIYNTIMVLKGIHLHHMPTTLAA